MLSQAWYYKSERNKDKEHEKGMMTSASSSSGDGQAKDDLSAFQTFALTLPDQAFSNENGVAEILAAAEAAFEKLSSERENSLLQSAYGKRLEKAKNAFKKFTHEVEKYYNLVGTAECMVNRLEAFEKAFRSKNPPGKGISKEPWYVELDDVVIDKLYQVNRSYQEAIGQSVSTAEIEERVAREQWGKDCRTYWTYVGQCPIAIAWTPLVFTLYIVNSTLRSSDEGAKTEKRTESSTKAWNAFSFYKSLKPTAKYKEADFDKIREVYEELKKYFKHYAPLEHVNEAGCPVFDWDQIRDVMCKNRKDFSMDMNIKEKDEMEELLRRAKKTSALYVGWGKDYASIPTLISLCNYNRILPLMWNKPVKGVNEQKCKKTYDALKKCVRDCCKANRIDSKERKVENTSAQKDLSKENAQFLCCDFILQSSFCEVYKHSQIMDIVFARCFSQQVKAKEKRILTEYRKLFTHCATIIENVLFDSAMSNTGSGGQLQPDTAQMFNRTKYREDALTAVKSIADCIKESDMSAYKDVCIPMLGSNQFSSKSEWETITGIKYVPGKKTDKQTGHTATEHMAWLLVCEAYLSWLYSESSQAVEKALREILNG